MIVTFHCKPKIKMLDHDCPHVHSQSSFHWLWKHISKWWSLLMGCYLVRLSSKAYVSFSHPISVILVVYAKRKKKNKSEKTIGRLYPTMLQFWSFFLLLFMLFFLWIIVHHWTVLIGAKLPNTRHILISSASILCY